MTQPKGRALHYVFRVGNRQRAYDFYVKLLGMKVLRHEEFSEGCEATCNGPYANHWSKTMIGYGDEDTNFVLEITYNYGVTEYQLGNDYRGIYIESEEAVARLEKDASVEKRRCGDFIVVKDSDQHDFYVKNGAANAIKKASLNVKNVEESKKFWTELCGLQLLDSDETKRSVTLAFQRHQCHLELTQIADGQAVERGTAYGRIAFSIPTADIRPLEERVRATNAHYVQTPWVRLDTPGKATVEVIILRDPDDHEICFVGDEAYRQLSVTDPAGDEALQKSIKDDPSLKPNKLLHIG